MNGVTDPRLCVTECVFTRSQARGISHRTSDCRLAERPPHGCSGKFCATRVALITGNRVRCGFWVNIGVPALPPVRHPAEHVAYRYLPVARREARPLSRRGAANGRRRRTASTATGSNTATARHPSAPCTASSKPSANDNIFGFSRTLGRLRRTETGGFLPTLP